MKNDIETLHDRYCEKVMNEITANQEANTIPTVYSLNLNGKNCVMSLPRSVMMQKKLIHLRNAYLMRNDFESDEALTKAIVENITIDNHAITVNDLEYDELEVVKTAYMDKLLLPLSLGGDKAVTNYKKTVLGE